MVKKFIHKKDNYILSSGKTGLFYCHAEVQMYIADAYGNQVIREVDSCSYQRISFQLLVHLHSLHSGKGACAHTLFFFAASTTLKVDSRGHSRHSARRKSFSSWLWFSFFYFCLLSCMVTLSWERNIPRCWLPAVCRSVQCVRELVSSSSLVTNSQWATCADSEPARPCAIQPVWGLPGWRIPLHIRLPVSSHLHRKVVSCLPVPAAGSQQLLFPAHLYPSQLCQSRPTCAVEKYVHFEPWFAARHL